MTLEDLKPAEGSTSKSKRVGRGRSSGHGKTSCRGHNGEGQRSGASSKRGFEGGQMPSYRRLPKLKGFKVINQLKYAELNVSSLEKLPVDEISLDSLKAIKKAHSSCDGLRILG
ncbi:MAG: 50S ribosomal protein L15, partial [bacterium]|nr:50S ribosomal protein L15 [bacterium]